MKNIVVVDDEQYICNIIMEALGEFPDFAVHKFTAPQEAADFISENSVDLVLTDLVMGNFSGEKILDAALANHPDAVVILMTGYPTVKTAISVLRRGGYDYLIKPFKLEDLKATIQRGLEHQRIKRENVELHSQLELMKVTDAMTSGMKLQPLLELIVRTTASVLPQSSASILLRKQTTGEFTPAFRSASNHDPAVVGFLDGDMGKCTVDFRTAVPGIVNEELVIDNKPHKCSYVAYPLISRGGMVGFLNVVYTDRFNHIKPGQLRLLSLLASTAASAVESSNQDSNLRKSYMQTIRALANAIEARDRYTAGHTDRVYRIARVIARKMGWNSTRMARLRTGCLLHDIGKIGVPDSILNKPGQLTEFERNIMKKHPELGVRILGGIPFLRPIMPYIIAHHEKYDGTGYPHGLKGEGIPIEGRLLAVVDTFDAILSDRPYRPGGDPQYAQEELVRNKGTQFDPLIVDLFLEAYHDGSINSNIIYGRAGLNLQMLNSV